MDEKPTYRQLWERAHQEACDREELYYKDPKTGFNVFTRIYLERRGFCCRSGCRHCPYGYPRAKSRGRIAR